MSERQLPPSWDGGVVLDIGGDIGALVLRASQDLDGEEIDLRPEDPTKPNVHSVVRARQSADGETWAAVYPALDAGTYEIVGTAQCVAIAGAQVTDAEYTATDSPPRALVDHHHQPGGNGHSHGTAR